MLDKGQQGREAGRHRVDDIIEAAAGLFRDRGFAATSMSDVASLVGVSKAALYHHFASKEDLFVAVAMREPRAAAVKMQEIAASNEMWPGDKLRLILDLAYDNIICSLPGQMMPTIAEVSSLFPDVAARFREGFIKAQQAALKAVIVEGIAKGDFKPREEVEIMVELAFGPPIMLSLMRAMYAGLKDETPPDIQALKARHAAALLRILT